MKAFGLFAAVIIASIFYGARAQAGMFTTPAGVCKNAGFEGNAREECASRVQRERRSRFWNESSTGLLLGPVGSLMDSARYGTQPGLHRIEVEGSAYYVMLHNSSEATVRSVVQYKNIKGEVAQWRRAGELATGCAIDRSASDMDTLYLWLNCQQNSAAAIPAISANNASALSTADEIEKLAALRDKGILTEAEFQAQKSALLKKQLQ